VNERSRGEREDGKTGKRTKENTERKGMNEETENM
jgi:hypothetical protein